MYALAWVGGEQNRDSADRKIRMPE